MKKNAFTIVELLGIITVIGIILLMAAPSLTSTLKKSEEKKCNDYKNTVYMAAENYFYENEDQSSVTVDVLENQGYIKEDRLYKDECDNISSISRDDISEEE